MNILKFMSRKEKGALSYSLFGNREQPKRPVVVSGPCVIESEEVCMEIGETLKKLQERRKYDIIFKASFDKANRTSLDAFRGPGIKKGLEILQGVKKEFGLPILTDVHCTSQAEAAADAVDILQIPAFLCRQTDLLVRTAKTGVPINIKKGQFMAPWDMKNSIQKVRDSGNEMVMVTERGTQFGYNNLVVDMCALPILRENNVPVIFDATHSVQTPGGEGSRSGGKPQFIRTLALSAAAAGVDGLFFEVHPNPQKALCDASSSLVLDELEDILVKAMEVDGMVKGARER